MSFIGHNEDSRILAPGYFLASADCERITAQIAQSGATTIGANKVVKAGTVYPANNNTAIGIVYEDIDVTSGNMPGSVVTKGTVYEDRLAVDLDSDAKTALIAKGFTFIEAAPAVTRPY